MTPSNKDQAPFYHLVPKELYKNLRYREQVVQTGLESPALAEDIWIMCARDILFWVNTFVFGYDPRLAGAKEYPTTPFITSEFQDPLILGMQRALGLEDIGIEKSRDLGASWMILLTFLHAWLFRENLSFALVSRKEDLVDKTDDPDCLMWKLDWVLRHMPGFLVPSFSRQKLTLANLDNGCTFNGGSTTSDVLRGGRKTAAMFDEFAAVTEGEEILPSSQHTTKSRFVNSTPKGAAGAYYDFMQNVRNKFTLHWSQHPEKNRGLYTSMSGKVKILDPKFLHLDIADAIEASNSPWYDYSENFQFRADAHQTSRWGVRSPWYDHECERATSRAEIAQELDVDYHGSDYQFFDSLLLQKLIETGCVPPLYRGELVHEIVGREVDVSRFEAHPEGRLKIWSMPVPEHVYGLGVDVSAGTGASNSCISIGDVQTGEKVAEFACPHETGYDFAALAVGLATFYNGAHMIWEAQGPGRPFGRYVTERFGYLNVYFRRSEDKLSRKSSDIPGWWSTLQGKVVLLTDYATALKREEFRNRSDVALEEAKCYIRMIKNDSVAHSRSQATKDPSGARSNHGDRVIADALCRKAMGELPEPEPQEAPDPPAGSIAHRWELRKQFIGKAKEAHYSW